LFHPSRGLEINLRYLKGNRNVHTMTMAEMLTVSVHREDCTVTLKVSPSYCTGSGDCDRAISTEIDI
jgi:hypothetical protein